MTLSGSKVEWVTLPEALKEVIFLLLQIMKFFNNNSFHGKSNAIFMARNVTVMICTEHMDIGNKYVNKYTEDGIV